MATIRRSALPGPAVPWFRLAAWLAVLAAGACGPAAETPDPALADIPPGEPMAVAVLPVDLADAAAAPGLTHRGDPPVAVGSVAIDARAVTRAGAPIAVDLVLARTAEQTNALDALSPADWPATKAVWAADSGSETFVMSFSVDPGASIGETPLGQGGEALAAFIFASYPGGGVFKVRTEGAGLLRIEVDNHGIAVAIEQ